MLLDASCPCLALRPCLVPRLCVVLVGCYLALPSLDTTLRPGTTLHFPACTLHLVAAELVVGKENVTADFNPTMGAEDFSYMLNERPGCYAFLGQAGG